MDSIKQFFVEHTKYKINNILDVKLISDGYTNVSYQLELKNHQKFFIKLHKQNHHDMIDDKLLYHHFLKPYIIYANNNNYIIKWIKQSPVDKTNPNQTLNYVKKLFEQIKKFQRIKLTNHVPIFNFGQYIDALNSKMKYFELYNKILVKHLNDKLVLSHGDVCFKNTLNVNNHPILIDYEWMRINYYWFDYINVICEEELYDHEYIELLKKTLGFNNDKTIYELIFIRWFFCWSWAKSNPDFINIKQYEKRSKINYKKFYKLIK